MNKKTGPILLTVLATTLYGTLPYAGISPVRAVNTSISSNLPSVVKIPRGGRVTLPVDGVTRVLLEDDDVARGSFVNGKAIIEGLTIGETEVEIYQKNNKRQKLLVQVQESDQLTQGTGAATPAVTTPVAATSDTAKPLTTGGSTDSGGSTIPALPNTGTTESTTTQPATVLPPVTQPNDGNITASAPRTSNLNVSLGVTPAEDNPSQALFTVTYGNKGNEASQNVKLHYALDDLVSYVANSATGDVHYDAAARELVWNIGTMAPNTTNKVSFRVQPIESGPTTFYSVATIEDVSGVSVSSNTIKYITNAAPLLTVFALPDRFLAGRNAPVLVDVKGVDMQSVVDRLQKMGIISGSRPGLFLPSRATTRAEYAVMTLNGLNLRDLRDVTAIKFVLTRRSTVNLEIRNSRNKVVATLVRNMTFEPGERTVLWDGLTGTEYAPAGRYTYVCTAKDLRGDTTTLKGNITIVPQTPLEPRGVPSFVDVKASDWYAGYLAIAEKQAIAFGYPGRLFRPERIISRVEATAIVIRALGLEDLAKQRQAEDPIFLDSHDIPSWARGYVFVATNYVKTIKGKGIMAGYPSNFFLPMRALRRDEAAIIVHRLIDRETDRVVKVSGQLSPGAALTIDGHTVQAADDGRFEFELKQNTAQPSTVAVFSMLR